MGSPSSKGWRLQQLTSIRGVSHPSYSADSLLPVTHYMRVGNHRSNEGLHVQRNGLGFTRYDGKDLLM